MRQDDLINLDECTEFRQSLQARPPRIVHGTVALLVVLLGSAITWAALAPANLVVRAPGRVRPVSTPQQVFAAFGTKLDGRVVEVNYREGEPVHEGQLLIRLDSEQLDNVIARQTRAVETLQHELTRLADLRDLRRRQFEAAQAKAQAELDHALADVDLARGQRDARIRLAEVELDAALTRLTRKQDLFDRQALSRADLMDAETTLRQAQEKLAEAQLPVDDAPVHVARRGLELVEQEHLARQAELELSVVTKEGDLASAHRELSGLNLERAHATLRAPMDGVVVTPAVKVGDVLERGRPVLEIASRIGLHFEVAVPSGDVGHLQSGMPVRVKFDAYDYQQYGTLAGTVCFISPDSRIPEQDEPQIPVYIVEVKLQGNALSRSERHGEVKLGMTGHAEIVTGQESILALLIKRIRSAISLG